MALGVGLILLALMSMLGLAAIRQTAWSARLAAHSFDQSIAFQVADSTLRDIESRLEQVKPEPTSGPCTDFLSGAISVRTCPPPAAPNKPRWLDSTFSAWSSTTTVAQSAASPTPYYFVEYLGNTFPCNANTPPVLNCRRYRITVRVGTMGRAQAMLQSIYATN